MKVIVFVAAFLVTTVTCWSQVSLKHIGLKHGDFQVGFRHYTIYDSSRSYSRIYDWTNEVFARPLPVSIWYPSSKPIDGTKKMTVLDYMRVLKEEEEWEHLPDEQILNWFYYPNNPGNQQHLREESIAFNNLTPIRQKFPVIIYAPSYQASSIENFALCEYLSSHGYVVISAASRGADNRFLEGGTLKDVETQARDIEFLIAHLSRLPFADEKNIASVGFSFGGLSNVLAQMRNHRLKAIASLDGSIKYQYSTLKKSPFASVDKVNVPFIHMAQKNIPEKVLMEDKLDPALNTNFEFFDSLRFSHAYSLQFKNLTHAYFSTLGVLFQPRDQRQDKNDSEILESYGLVCLYTLRFMNLYIKGDSNETDFPGIDSGTKHVSREVVYLRSKLPERRVFTIRDFNELAAKRYYKNLPALYDSVQQKHPSLLLKESDLNNLGLQLVFNKQNSAYGIQVLLLAVRIYPRSANLFDSLAEGYLFMQDKSNAIKNFRTSLQLDASNENAGKRLKMLETR